MSFFKNKKLGLTIWLCSIILLSLMALADNLNNLPLDEVYIKVEEEKISSQFFFEDSVRPTIRTFDESTVIKGHPYLKIKEGNMLLKLFAPGDDIFLDPIYTLLILSICIIFLIRMKTYNVEKPFSSQMVEGLKQAGITCFIFAAADYFRLCLVNKHIQSITQNIYHLEKFTIFSIVAFWIGILLSSLYKIMKKAEVLQQEQDLTV